MSFGPHIARCQDATNQPAVDSITVAHVPSLEIVATPTLWLDDRGFGGFGDDNALGGEWDRLFGWTGNDSLDGSHGRDVPCGGAGDVAIDGASLATLTAPDLLLV